MLLFGVPTICDGDQPDLGLVDATRSCKVAGGRLARRSADGRPRLWAIQQGPTRL